MGERRSTRMPVLERPTEEEATSAFRDGSPGPKKQLPSPERHVGSSTAKASSHAMRPSPNAPESPCVSSVVASQRLNPTSTATVTSIDDTLDPPKDRRQRPPQTSPSWPTSPRLKSPPPSIIRANASKKQGDEHTQSNTIIKRLAPVSVPELGAAMQVNNDSHLENANNLPAVRASNPRASAQPTGLETVVEGSVPTTSSAGPVKTTSQRTQNAAVSLDTVPEIDSTSTSSKTDVLIGTETLPKINVEKADAASVSAPTSRAASSSRPAGAHLAKRSFTSLTTAGKKPIVEPMRSMTVETETVTSAPPIVGDRSRDAHSVKTKPSTETIRPKKERKRPIRKTPSLHAGTGTTKADIFEAKIASAVDEADSSDSDETFVYESNPPEPPRQGRHHSRTPSATSLASQVDHFGARGKHAMRSGSTATVIQGKKSMKFSSGGYGSQHDADGASGEGGQSSTRMHTSTPRHHHIGRHGRNGHTSLFDHDSPFTQANRNSSPRTPAAPSTRNSRPNSPRLTNGKFFTTRKNFSGGYDTYDDAAADDERAPLVGSVRVNRSRHGRRAPPHFRSMEFTEDKEQRCWPRFSGCIFLVILIALGSVGLTTFMVALNRPLIEVEVRRISNVIASEQLLMFDLHVRAVNPNLFAITVSDMDVHLLAESPYVGTSSQWRAKQPGRRSPIADSRARPAPSTPQLASWFPPFRSSDGVDEGTDPIEDEPGAQMMVLGRIYELDSPLIFDASPLRHVGSSSAGQIRLAKPGNRTEDGGSARWERVLQHPFQLIVRGVMKYQLPLSSHSKTAKISGHIRVSPEDSDPEHDPDDHDDDDNGSDGGSNSTAIDSRS